MCCLFFHEIKNIKSDILFGDVGKISKKNVVEKQEKYEFTYTLNTEKTLYFR